MAKRRTANEKEQGENALLSDCQKTSGRCRRARRPSDCHRIRGLCRRGGAFSAFSRKHSLHGGAAGRAFQARPATECNPRKSARSTFSTRREQGAKALLFSCGKMLAVGKSRQFNRSSAPESAPIFPADTASAPSPRPACAGSPPARPSARKP